MGKVWLCQECRTVMQHQEAGFDKCPLCGAEAWPDGEGTYQRDKRGAELGVKKHGVWYCQRCRVPMIPIDEYYCKCPECAAEVWYGDRKREDAIREIRAMMETADGNPYQEPGGLALPNTRPVKGGGGHTRVRHKADMRKPTTEELYRRLCE